MPKLAVFGDEIDASIAIQIEVMQSEGVNALELRGAEGKGVLDLDGQTREQVRDRLRDAGVEVFSIGSPLGKSKIEAPFDKELDRLKQAIEQAQFFGAPRIRIFSFFIPDKDYAPWRDEVMRRMAAMAAQAEQAGVVLCHENESRIYGETVANCKDLLETVNSPALRAIHDAANYQHNGETSYPEGYEAVLPWLEYMHIKDWGDGQVQPAGEGDGRLPEVLAALKANGYDGYLSLEPHLGGGPDNFRRAARALKQMLADLDWTAA